MVDWMDVIFYKNYKDSLIISTEKSFPTSRTLQIYENNKNFKTLSELRMLNISIITLKKFMNFIFYDLEILLKNYKNIKSLFIDSLTVFFREMSYEEIKEDRAEYLFFIIKKIN